MSTEIDLLDATAAVLTGGPASIKVCGTDDPMEAAVILLDAAIKVTARLAAELAVARGTTPLDIIDITRDDICFDAITTEPAQ